MEYRFATIGELGDIARRHPALSADRPDLCKPAFPSNPVSSGVEFPFIFYVIDAGKVVGSRKAIADRAIVNGKEYPWAWCFDTVVDQCQRGQGIGSRLVKLQVEEFDRLGIISSAAFSAPAMMQIYHRLGYRVFDFTPRMTLVRNASPFLAMKLKNRLLSSLLGRIGTTILSLESAIRGAKKSLVPFEIAPVAEAEFSRYFTQAHLPEQPNDWAVSPDWVVSRIQRGDDFLKVTCSGSSDPSAIFVLRGRAANAQDGAAARRLSLMYFKFLGDGAEGGDLLAAALARQLFERQLDVADIITSSPSLLSALSKRGYRARGTGMSFVYKVPPGIEIEGAADIADWHLTHFCSDGFLFV